MPGINFLNPPTIFSQGVIYGIVAPHKPSVQTGTAQGQPVLDWDALGRMLQDEHGNVILTPQENKPDAVDTVGAQGQWQINKKISTLELTVGRYRLTVGNPKSVSFSDFKPSEVQALVGGVGKNISVDGLSYNVGSNKLYVDINVKKNPIPLFVIWGVVAIVVMATGALAANSVLEEVTPIVKSPIAYGVVLILLIPVLIAAWRSFRGHT